MRSVYHIYQFGDQSKLGVKLDCKKILDELKPFDKEWSQYNTVKPYIHRKGLCVINERGETGPGPALESLGASAKKYNYSKFDERDFNKITPVYTHCHELQKILQDILPSCVRTHFIRLGPGGYFPPHRDSKVAEQTTFRLIVPIQSCNPPYTRFMIEDKTLHWQMGYMYVVNTTKEHTLFNTSDQDSIWLVVNAIVNNDTFDFVRRNLKI